MRLRSFGPPIGKRPLVALVASATLVAMTAGAGAGIAAQGDPAQPVLSTRTADIIAVDGLEFRDLDGSGDLTPYEDWRLSADGRAVDLVKRLSVEEKAGLLVHGTMDASADSYDLASFQGKLSNKHITTYISRLSLASDKLAEQHNKLQALAENEPYGIPVLISTDPRSGFTVKAGETVSNADFSAFPDPNGLGAIDDPALTKEIAGIIRSEYAAVGIREGLSPQADIATEPRWSRIDGTFGSVGVDVKPQVSAYVEGMQAGTMGLNENSVATVVKHWVGYGAQENGYDSHYYYGRYATFPGGNFDEHLIPYEGAFEAGAAGIMPTYSILKNLELNGSITEQVGAGHNDYLLQDLLRKQYGFDGVITSDWGITNDCPQECKGNRPPNFFVGKWGAGMSWGVESLTVPERFASTINAGVDIIGGTENPENVVAAYNQELLSMARIDDAATRVLKQKFELGIFENPYVDTAAAKAIVGSSEHRAMAIAAQQKSLTLLSNKKGALPHSSATSKKVYLSGISAAAATSAGFTPVDDLAEADLAVVRLSDPKGGQDLTDLNFTGSEADFKELAAAHAAGVKTIAVPHLNRPLILGNVVENSDAVLANYGVSDAALFNVLKGDAKPEGTLPFDLASSMAEVAEQYSDVPNDTANPDFEYRFGLAYADVDVPTTEPSEPAETTDPTGSPSPTATSVATAAQTAAATATAGVAAGTKPGGQDLASTGFDSLSLVLGAGALGGAGALLLLARRRRIHAGS